VTYDKMINREDVPGADTSDGDEPLPADLPDEVKDGNPDEGDAEAPVEAEA
jgi:hypothetical protein